MIVYEYDQFNNNGSDQHIYIYSMIVLGALTFNYHYHHCIDYHQQHYINKILKIIYCAYRMLLPNIICLSQTDIHIQFLIKLTDHKIILNALHSELYYFHVHLAQSCHAWPSCYLVCPDLAQTSCLFVYLEIPKTILSISQ